MIAGRVEAESRATRAISYARRIGIGLVLALVGSLVGIAMHELVGWLSALVVAVLFGAVFFGEWPNTLAMVGISMIVVCGLGVLFHEERALA